MTRLGARLAYPSLEDPAAREIAERCRSERSGRLYNLHHMLLHAPRIASGWLALATAVRYDNGLPDRVRELAICQVACRTASSYEWAHHAPLAREAGCSSTQLASLPEWRDAGFDAVDRVVLAYTDAVLDNSVDDTLFAELARYVDETGIIELTVTVTAYLSTSRFLSALGIELEPETRRRLERSDLGSREVGEQPS